MFRKLLAMALLGVSYATVQAQCTTTNATSCVCADGTSNCLLLPDITASWLGISNNGYTEYPQTGAGTNYTGQGPDNGRLRVTGSTPNIGHGSFTVRGLDANGKRAFVCGTDTFFNVAANGEFVCPNGVANPKQLLIQRIYQKNGNAMSYVDVWAGSMTYHPSHGHNHVDDWAIMTLRIATSDPHPLNWPIVGEGAKIGFCLMDYGQCGNPGSTYDGHCRDDNTVFGAGNVLHNGDFPNFNLGGGNYNCSVVEQGISSGWTDVYGKHLDGMWINIPPGTCNGNYYIVMEVDKPNTFLEENDDNNWTAVPVTLNLQVPAGTPQTPVIKASGSRNLCNGGSVQLSVTAGTDFLWSTGETTQTITVSQPGTYTCTVTNYCGTNVSAPFEVNSVVPAAPVVTGAEDTICVSGSATLEAVAGGEVRWYDANGDYLLTGNILQTPILTQTTTYFAQSTESYFDTLFAEPHSNGIGGGGFVSSAQYEVFDAHVPFTLRSVLLYAQNSGNVTIQLQDSSGQSILSKVVSVSAGAQRVSLDFEVPVGSQMRLAAPSMTVSGLYRNNNSASYPYDMPGVLTITGASAGASYYYYFYDWEVVIDAGTCTSPQTEVQVVVDVCNSLNIAHTDVFKNTVRVQPNPSNGQMRLEFFAHQSADVQIEVFNMLGQRLHGEQIAQASGLTQRQLDLSALPEGNYLLQIAYQGQRHVERIRINN